MFCKGRSTNDALCVVYWYLMAVYSAQRMTVAVSLDIQNAFNMMKWYVVRVTLELMDFPPYLHGFSIRI